MVTAKPKADISIFVIFIIAAVSFWCLDMQRISMGDDLGYRFTDSQLHKGDGHPVTGLQDILETQKSHYLTTNGRVIVHSLTQFFICIAPSWLFPVCNAVMFALLWLLALRLAIPSGVRPTSQMAAFMLLLIWLCVPRPGTTFLSLTAFAINYLWAATAYIFFILSLRRSFDGGSRFSPGTVAAAIAALIAGSLQESFSLPLSGAIVIGYIFFRHRFSPLSYALAIGFGIGTCIVTFAPGNFVRLGAGAPLAVKLSLLARDIVLSPLPVLLIAIITLRFLRPKLLKILWRSHFLLLLAIGISLILAAVTFTGVRQLVAMSLFSAILLATIVFSTSLCRFLISRPAIIGIWAVLGLIFAGAWVVRQDSLSRYKEALKQAENPTSRICADSRNAFYNTRPLLSALFSRYNDDPIEGSDLKLLFDANTKRALSRLRKARMEANGTIPGRDIVTILPAPAAAIMAEAERSSLTPDSTIIPATLDRRYSCLAICAHEKHVPCIRDEKGAIVHFECFRIDSTVCYVIETPTRPLNLRGKK